MKSILAILMVGIIILCFFLIFRGETFMEDPEVKTASTIESLRLDKMLRKRIDFENWLSQAI